MSRFWFLGIAILIKNLRHTFRYRELIWALAAKDLKLRWQALGCE
jgi:ABC-type polysaccharide/polyol phosphate export permease